MINAYIYKQGMGKFLFESLHQGYVTYYIWLLLITFWLADQRQNTRTNQKQFSKFEPILPNEWSLSRRRWGKHGGEGGNRTFGETLEVVGEEAHTRSLWCLFFVWRSEAKTSEASLLSSTGKWHTHTLSLSLSATQTHTHSLSPAICHTDTHTHTQAKTSEESLLSSAGKFHHIAHENQ